MVDLDSLVVGLDSLEVVLGNLVVDLVVDIILMEDIVPVVDISLKVVDTDLMVGTSPMVDIDPVEDTGPMVDILMVGLDNLKVVLTASVPIIIVPKPKFMLDEQPTTKLELIKQPSQLAVVLVMQQPIELSFVLELEHFVLALLAFTFSFTFACFAFAQQQVMRKQLIPNQLDHQILVLDCLGRIKFQV